MNQWMRVEKDNILYDHFLSRTLDFFKKVNKLSFSKEPFILNKVSPKEKQLPLRFLHLDLLQEECCVNVRRKSKIEKEGGGDHYLWRSTKRKFNMSYAR